MPIEVYDPAHPVWTNALLNLLQLHHPDTYRHSVRVARYTEALTRKVYPGYYMLLPVLTLAALLHDIGKVGVPTQILDKSTPLSDDDWMQITLHPLFAVQALEPLTLSQDVKTAIVQHHEKYDGTGYPYQIVGENIHPYARILAVCDVYDALTSERPYSPAITHDAAIKILKERAGKQFCPICVAQFLTISEAQLAHLRELEVV